MKKDSWLLHACSLLLIAWTILWAYLPSLHNGFVDWDDLQNFAYNPWLTELKPASWRWAWETSHLGVYQPLSWTLILLQTLFFGVNPEGYHAVSIALHLAIALLLYGWTGDILRRVRPPHVTPRYVRGPLITLAVLVIMVHPLRVEVVAWSSCQPYLLSILFTVMGFWLYLHAVSPEGQIHKGKMTGALTLFIGACLSKTLILPLPLILLVLDHYPLQRQRYVPRRQLVLEKAPFVLLSLVTLLAGLWAHGKDHPFLTLEELSLKGRLVKVGLGLSHYWKTLFLPTQLAAFYPSPPSWDLAAPTLLVLCAFCAFIGFVVKMRKKWPALFATGLVVGAWLVPHIGMIPTGRVVGADRYTYLASVSLTPLLASALLWAWSQSRLIKLPILLLTLGVTVWMAQATRAQLTTWQDSLSLWTRALDVAKEDNAELYFNVANSLRAAKKDADAVAFYRKSIQLDPLFEKSYLNLGALYTDLNQPDLAIPLYQELLRLQPSSAAAHGNLGLAYLMRHDAALAEIHLVKACQLAPLDSDFVVNLAKFYVLTQRPERALEPLLRMKSHKRLDPQTEKILGKIYFEARDFAEARAAWLRAQDLSAKNGPDEKEIPCLLRQLDKVSPFIQGPRGSGRATEPRQDQALAVGFAQPWSDPILGACH